MSKRSLQKHKLRTGCSEQEVQTGQRSHWRSDRRVLFRSCWSIGRSRNRFQRQGKGQVCLPELRQGVRKEDVGSSVRGSLILLAYSENGQMDWSEDAIVLLMSYAGYTTLVQYMCSMGRGSR